MKLRLGTREPDGFTLKAMLADFDSGFDGRWNAGANKRLKSRRPGGGDIPPEVYATEVRRRVEERLAELS